MRDDMVDNRGRDRSPASKINGAKGIGLKESGPGLLPAGGVTTFAGARPVLVDCLFPFPFVLRAIAFMS